jgi:hypothetical protein
MVPPAVKFPVVVAKLDIIIFEFDHPRLEAIKTLIVRDPALSVGVFTFPTIKFATLIETETEFPVKDDTFANVPFTVPVLIEFDA